jgi:hypothetical protein
VEGIGQPSGFAIQMAGSIAVFYDFVKVPSPTLAKLQ